MGSATVSVVGNVATELKVSGFDRDQPGRERVSFRVISTERRRDAATGSWIDGDEFAVTVVCWGALARNVADSVRIGEPVLVAGRLTTRRYELEGETKYVTELKASQIGHDLSRGRASFRRISQPSTSEPQDSGVGDSAVGAAAATAAAGAASGAASGGVGSGSGGLGTGDPRSTVIDELLEPAF